MEVTKDFREKMIFQGYATYDLDVAATAFREKHGREATTFLVRSPYLLSGSIENRRRIVISAKYGGFAAIYIPIYPFTLEQMRSALEDFRDFNIRMAQRKRKLIEEFENIKEEDAERSYDRHCNYCGVRYYTSPVDPKQHCELSDCRMKHKEYIEQVKDRRRSARESKEKTDDEPESHLNVSASRLPDFNLDNAENRSLQGYIYFVEAANGYFKIGRSDNPSKRFVDLVNMSPVPLWLRHSIFSDNYVLAEGRIHQMMSEHRKHGEWFELPDSELEWCLSLDHYGLDDD